MSRSAWAVVARHWGELSRARAGDAILLERFRRHRDQAAFTDLVLVHGPMVRAVCRRIVRDPHTADDAFQAVFLALARKAGSVRDADRLGPWLHRVAVRVATRAARAARRRSAREAGHPGALDQTPAPGPTTPDPELAALLHAEIDRLPEPQRLAILLCDLQGLSHEQAAHRLGWPAGTVKSRQARARARLRDRLGRRGVAAPLAPVVGALAADAGAVLPAALAARTAAAILNHLTGTTAAVTATAAALTLAHGVSTPMWFSPLKLTALAALVGGGLIATQAGSRSPAHDPTQPAAPTTAARASGGLPPTGPALPDDPFGAGDSAGPTDDPFAGGEQDPAPAGGARPDEPKARRDRPVQAELGPATTPPLTPDARANLLAEREEAEVYGELLGNELAMTREVIQDLLRRLRQRRLDRLEQTDPLDEQGQKRWDLVTAALNSELETQQAAYQKGLAQQRNQRRLLADLDRKLEAPGTEPQRYKPGDVLLIEVLQALPGRPITGERVVKPDGTVNLGFYGEVRVAGLTGRETKAQVIRHLRRWLSDESLGLAGVGRDGGGPPPIDPADSDRVFVDEVAASRREGGAGESRVRALERQLDRLQQELRQLRSSSRPATPDPE